MPDKPVMDTAKEKPGDKADPLVPTPARENKVKGLNEVDDKLKGLDAKEAGEKYSTVTPQGAPAHDAPVMGDPLWRAPSGDAYHTTTQYLPSMGTPEQAKAQAEGGKARKTPLPARVVPEGGPTPEEQARMDRDEKAADAVQKAKKQSEEQQLAGKAPVGPGTTGPAAGQQTPGQTSTPGGSVPGSQKGPDLNKK